MAQQTAFDWQVHDGAGQRKYLNEEEVPHFLREVDRLSEVRRALCYLLANTGCRISEALALTRQQVDPIDKSVVLVTLKRRRVFYRRVSIPDYLLRVLLALPTNNDGRFWVFHRTTAWRFIKRTMRCAGIDGAWATIRGLRHAFGIRCAAQAVSPRMIQKWMGHATLRMTMVYLDATGIEERQYASRVWWPAGFVADQPAELAVPTVLPAAATTTEQRQDIWKLEQENESLRQENAQLRQLCESIISTAGKLGVQQGIWRHAC